MQRRRRDLERSANPIAPELLLVKRTWWGDWKGDLKVEDRLLAFSDEDQTANLIHWVTEITGMRAGGESAFISFLLVLSSIVLSLTFCAPL